MQHFNYLIIGAGMTAAAAVKGIRELDAQGSIAMIGDDHNPPYSRPPLSKALWKGKPIDIIWRKISDDNVALFLGREVTAIDPANKRVTDDRGEAFSYDKLLIATGGKPRKLPFGGDGVIYFRTLDDYEKLHALRGKNLHFGIIGGGFIGSELAAALAMNGEKVTMVFPEDGIGFRIFPREIALYINDYYRAKGVEVRAGTSIQDIQPENGGYALITGEGERILVDAVIAGIGIIPGTALAKEAGLQVNSGIIVDEFLRTNQADIYAAGDVAEIYQPLLEKQFRLEHADNAISMGKQAGRIMAGSTEAYDHLSFFYSDLFELGYEAVGELDSRMETVIDWQEPFKKGVIYYLSEGKVRGVLLWNVWDTVAAARELIAEPGPFTAADLKNRLG